jgi:hypothetical protein
MGKRYYASVRQDDDAPPVRHFVGLPPELGAGKPGPVPFPRPDVLIITADPQGGVMLDRYTAAGAVAGDTWHETGQCAMAQAELEYPDAVGEWQEVPEEVQDVVAFGLSRYREQRGTGP